MTKIVGIFLVKNEDIFIQFALKNILDFCDNIIVLDNNSTDDTFTILEEIQKTYPNKIRLHRLSDALLSHSFIEKYANTDTWIFAIDGDEIYDSRRLEIFREDILSGKYNQYWNILGNCAHLKDFDLKKDTAWAYMAPPSRSITKLYNFNAITEWKEYTERLHGKKMKFKKGFDESKTLLLQNIYTWGDSPLRCLHMCFVKRSSKNNSIRFNPSENAKPYFFIVNLLRNILHGNLSIQSSYKLKKYQRGKAQEIKIVDFLKN